MASLESPKRTTHPSDGGFDKTGRLSKIRHRRTPQLDAPGLSSLTPISKPSLQQPGVARFALPGRRSEMAEIAGDPRLSDMTVRNVAANKIQSFVLRRLASRRKTELAPEVAEARMQRALSHKEKAKASMSEAVGSERAGFAKRAARISSSLMSEATDFQGPSIKRAIREAGPEGDFREVFAHAHESEPSRKAVITGSQMKPEAEMTPQEKFVARMTAMAGSVRGSMYFNGEDQGKILSSGALYAKFTRKALKMGDESHTSDADDTRLGNHDHVFFFLEHRDSPMRANSRFTSESTSDGLVTTRHADEDGGVAPGSRRISFPLQNLMQQGTWAMKQDFLTPEAGKTLAPQDNVVTSSERDPRLAAAHFMQQLAVSALDMPTFKNKGKPRSAEIQRHLPMGDREFVESVFHHALRPQLMVPTAVNLNTRGGILDMPIAEAPRHGVSPQQGPAKMQASAAAHTTDP